MAKDKLQNTVEAALIKNRWINIKPCTLKYEDIDLLLDIIADKLISADKQGLKIAVEVKSFGIPHRFTRWGWTNR